MKKGKVKVAILYGGRSPEHQISLLSAKNVFNSVDTALFDPILIGIDKKGSWHLSNAENIIKGKICHDNSTQVILSQNTDGLLISQTDGTVVSEVNVMFPVLHGTYGEDGSVQGLAKLANLPCVGCGIAGSAVGMDKDLMKHILKSHDIPTADWATVRNSGEGVEYEFLKEHLGDELFIKPANLGSSIGVSKITNADEFRLGLDQALAYDHKVIIEEKIIGREIECAVLGNEAPKASIPGEIVVKSGIYSYDNKYVDAKGAELHIPAPVSEEQAERIQDLALKTFVALECRGMTRVDMFLTEEDSLIINEVNTIPGFTDISMYPKLWEASGLSQKDLVTELIQLAIEENQRTNSLKS